MGLIEFLRQWQKSRMAVGIAVSVLLHVAVIVALMGGRLPLTRVDVKRGEPLMVELPSAPDSPPPGRPGPESGGAPSAPAPATPPAPPSPAARPAPAPKAPASRHAESAPAPRPPQPERRVAAATPPPPAVPPSADSLPAPKTEPFRPAPQAETAAPPAPAQSSPAPQAAERQVASLPPSSGAPAAPDIRTALRRGSGAGGSGEGRAGIEGEPIPLDSKDPRYSDYLDRVRRAIKEKWGYPCVKNDSTHQCEYKTAQLIIEFGINKNGKLAFSTIVRSSGYPIYDDYAINAVKLADFPPIPDSFSKKGVPILATFSYVVESSLTNILR
jgi:TonB family protein